MSLPVTSVRFQVSVMTATETMFCLNTTSISSILLQGERALQSSNVGKRFFVLYATGDRVDRGSLELSGHGSASYLEREGRGFWFKIFTSI